MDRDTSGTSIPALRDGSFPRSVNLGCFGDRLGPRPAFVRLAQGATAGLGCDGGSPAARGSCQG